MTSTRLVNGRHVTAIVVAICAAIVLAPVSVLATSSSHATGPIKVYITDPHSSSNKASVSSKGALNIDGTVSVDNLPATQNVSGNVTSVPGLPARLFSAHHSGGAVVTFDVPSGKTFVIQTVSAFVGVTTGNQILARIVYTNNGGTEDGELYLPVSFTETTGGLDFLDGTQDVTLYASGTISLIATSPNNGATIEADWSLSGYLI